MTTITSMLSKREQVREALLDELAANRYPADALFKSENVLARELGISRNILREAISSLVSDGYLYRIQGKGTYVADRSRNSHRRRLQHRINLLIGNPHHRGESDPFIGSILTGLHEALRDADCKIELDCVNDLNAAIAMARELAAAPEPPAAVILAGLDAVTGLTGIFIAAGIKCICIGRPEDPQLPYVDTDSRGAVKEAVRHLAGHGHRQIAFIDNSTSHYNSFIARLSGYRDGLAEAGIGYEPELMVEYCGRNDAAGAAAANLLIARRRDFTAAIVYGDWPTVGFIRQMAASGHEVPAQLSLISYSHYDWISQAAGMDITRISFNVQDLGRRAGNLLLSSLAGLDRPGYTQEIIEARLIPGASVKPR